MSGSVFHVTNPLDTVPLSYVCPSRDPSALYIMDVKETFHAVSTIVGLVFWDQPRRPSKHQTLIRCWFDIGPPSLTLNQR